MKYITHLLFFVLANNSVFAQDYSNYFLKLNKADSLLFIEKDTNNYIETLLSIEDRLFDQEYELARMFLQKGDSLNAKEFVKLSLEKGGGYSLFSKEILEQLNINYLECENYYYCNSKVNSGFINGINKLLGNDQLIRVLHSDSLIAEEVWVRTDSINLIELMNLIDIYGFPMIKDYGSQFHLFYILMIHLPYLDEDIYIRFLNFYKQNLSKGSITPDLLSYFIDRHDYSTHGGQTYGSLADPYFGVAKILNKETVEKRRNDLYLPTLKVFFAKRGIKNE
ncbi:MAG: hypothetical protein H6586_08240 [Flavobacteriales bacterium]|nr:hypothetical protein [Flavobacteriales bacterium]